MRLEVLEGRGGVTVLRVDTGDGRGLAETLVLDPAHHPSGPVPLAAWVCDAGGVLPLPLPKYEPKGGGR